MDAHALMSQGLDLLTKVSLLFALAGAAALLLRRHSAAGRHLAWSTALAGALVLPLVVPFAPEWSVPAGLPLPLRAATTVQPEAAALSLASFSPESVAALRSRAVTVDRLPSARPETTSPQALQAAPSRVPQPVVLALLAWALGAALVLSWTLRSHWMARRLVRRARPLLDPELEAHLTANPGGARVRLLESAEVDVPLATGLLRPALVVPVGFSEWSAERRRLVLLHELAHVERGDCFAQLVGRASVALWWFHPLAWLALDRQRREAEQAADDRVLESGTRPSEYAAHLLAVVRTLTGRGSDAAGLSMAGSHVERRLLALLDPARPRRRRSPLAVPVACLAVVATVTALGGLRAEAGPPREGPSSLSRPPQRVDSNVQAVLLTRQEDEGAPATRDSARRSEERRIGGRSAFTRAMNAHHQGRYEESAEGFGEAFAAGHSPALSAYNKACALARLGRDERALDWLETAFESGFSRTALLESDEDLATLRGGHRFEALRRAALERGASRDEESAARAARAERASEALETLQREGSQDPSAWSKAGYQLYRAQDWAGAERAWLHALELGRPSGKSLYNLACVLALQGRSAEAFDRLEEAVGLGYDDLQNLRRDEDLASLREHERYAKLVDLVEQLRLPGELNDLEAAQSQREHWVDFTERTGRIVRAHPSMGRAWNQHGVGLLRTERFEEAAAAFRRAAEAGHPEGNSRWNEACALARAGRTDEALDALERSMATDFGNAWSLTRDPDLESLHGHPRFEALAEREGGVMKKLYRAVERHVY